MPAIPNTENALYLSPQEAEHLLEIAQRFVDSTGPITRAQAIGVSVLRALTSPASAAYEQERFESIVEDNVAYLGLILKRLGQAPTPLNAKSTIEESVGIVKGIGYVQETGEYTVLVQPNPEILTTWPLVSGEQLQLGR